MSTYPATPAKKAPVRKAKNFTRVVLKRTLSPRDFRVSIVRAGDRQIFAVKVHFRTQAVSNSVKLPASANGVIILSQVVPPHADFVHYGWFH
jgi:hypothetical protein